MDVITDTKASVLIVGCDDHPDFAAVREFVRDVSVPHYLRVDPSPTRAPHCLLAFQSRPSELSQEWIELAHRANPLAPVLAILGSWCEGEMRSGHPWHGVERVYWYNAVGRLKTLLQRPSRGYFPRTVTPAEQVLHSVQGVSTVQENATAAIIASIRVAAETWADALRCLGYRTRWYRHIEHIDSAPNLIVWDTDDLNTEKFRFQLQLANSTFFRAKQLAVSSFPRREDVAVLAARSVQVLGKPLLLSDLASALNGMPLGRVLAVA